MNLRPTYQTAPQVHFNEEGGSGEPGQDMQADFYVRRLTTKIHMYNNGSRLPFKSKNRIMINSSNGLANLNAKVKFDDASFDPQAYSRQENRRLEKSPERNDVSNVIF